jgi:hypothetical protein
MQTLINEAVTIAPVTGTTEMRSVMTSERWWADRTWLGIEHVARVWTDERRAIAEEQAQRRRGRRRGQLTVRESSPVSEDTVLRYLKESRLKPDGSKNRYTDFPMPMPEPVSGRALVWIPGLGKDMDDLVHALRTWWRERPIQTRGGQGFYSSVDED